MKKKYIRSICSMAVGCCIVLPALAMAADATKTSGSVTVGIQNLNLNGDTGSKFEEYQDGLQDDITLNALELKTEKNDIFFNIEGQDIGQNDQYLGAEIGKYGKFKVKASWDEIIHNYYDNAKFIGTETAPGVWSVADSTQKTLGDPLLKFDPAQNTEPTAAGKAILQDFLDNSASVDLNVVREKGGIDVLYSLFKDFNLRAGFTHESKEGYRAISSGAYHRTGTGATATGGLGEVFRLYGLELPETIDYMTDVFSAGMDYRQDNWHIDFTYRFTDFSNRVDDLTWDNPFLLTGVDNIQGGSALNRLDLAPDSISHNVSLTGGVSDLPLNSKITATLSVDNVTQDDNFLAYTVNTALTDQNGNLVTTNRALPANDLDGDVTTTLFNLAINSKPISQLAVNLKYNYYDYKNDSRKITWDGYAGVGESLWYFMDGSAVAGNATDKGASYTNRVPEYTRTRAGADASYRINKMFTVIGDYTYDNYDRNEDRNADTTEDILGFTVKVKPMSWAQMRFGYHYADRTIDDSYQTAIKTSRVDEWDQSRMFDQSDRQRDSFDAYIGLDPTDQLSVGFSANYKNDDYDTSYYGLQDSESYMTGIDASYMLSENVTFTAYYDRDNLETNQRNRTKTGADGSTKFLFSQNDFNTNIEDTTDSVGLNVMVDIIPETLSLAFGADYSRATGDISTTNPNYDTTIPTSPTTSSTTSSATAYDWPELENKTTEITTDLNYKFTPQITCGLHYLYKRFQIEDFATDNLLAYNNVPDTQGNSLSQFIFMDSNYTDYEAHLFGATLKYSF